MKANPLAEVFGFPPADESSCAERFRKNRLCPYNNRVPSCTKDRANDPLGVCSIYDGSRVAITCPVRFRQGWVIAGHAADFFFPEGSRWTTLTEVRLADRRGRSAGNIDVVLVSYDRSGSLLDFGSLEVQAVYISGNVRQPFEAWMSAADKCAFTWLGHPLYPRADYLSSSRKRLAPQLIFKGGTLHSWKKRQAIALHSGFYRTLPDLPEVGREEAELAWLVYDLVENPSSGLFELVLTKTAYTMFEPALTRMTVAEPGEVESFIGFLQAKLDEKLEESNPPDAPLLGEVTVS
jgi:hypothetical protein